MKFMNDVISASTWLATLTAHEEAQGLQFSIVGSAVYMPDPKDVDIAVLLSEGSRLSDFCTMISASKGSLLQGRGWDYCGEQYEFQQQDKWQAMRKGNINLLITVDKEWYVDACTASDVCAALNLQSKGDRVRVHRVVRERMSWESARNAPLQEGVVD
jgi:hypothetical protein